MGQKKDMKAEIPETLNRFRLREGPMGTDDSAGYEGCFIVPSPYDKWTTLQCKSSELPPVGHHGIVWEHLSVIVKRDIPRKPLEQRQPNSKELAYLRTLFWEAEELIAVFIAPVGQDHTDHRVMNLWRPAEGFTECPEMYREPYVDEQDGPDYVSVEELAREKQAAAEQREITERADFIARLLVDLKQKVELAARHQTKDSVTLTFAPDEFSDLAKMLGIQ